MVRLCAQNAGALIDLQKALRCDCCGGSLDTVQALATVGALLNDEGGMWIAAYRGHLEIVELLLKEGVSPSSCTEGAVNSHECDVLLYLVSQLPEKSPHRRWVLDQCLVEAAASGRAGLLEYCLDQGATNFQDAACSAAERGHRDLLCRLVDLGKLDWNCCLFDPSCSRHMDKDMRAFVQKKAREQAASSGRVPYRWPGEGLSDYEKKVIEHQITNEPGPLEKYRRLATDYR